MVTEEWYFVSHRLAFAVAARAAGYDVGVATRVDRHGAVIRDAGISLFHVDFDRSGMRPLREISTIAALFALYRREAPDIVHHVAMKPVIYGSFAARAAGVPGVVNALGGLGFVFSSTTLRARTMRLLARPALKFALSGWNARLILQNSHDKQTVLRAGLARPEQIRLIRGAGVDPALYSTSDVAAQPPLIILPARLLREKGVGEFVGAARLLRARGVEARFALVGRPDSMNPASFSAKDVAGWVADGLVEAWGWREDMPAVFARAQIVCLPTYHEGLPKSLLEAAASGCAIVATDIPGCRELVSHGKTGLLVPPKEVERLADALEELIRDPAMRARLGGAAREMLGDFTLDCVTAQTMDIYAEVANG
ncbi:glycosyltransferase family 4 protein [Aurantimonas sp. C2-6-R+9]|uniref:glycosyltransferase family 4 protein n=1 Tax=Aurantimonas sp. C2-6-R+9 TaxID=3114365 RepID=UPI002E17718B|nr:glycosyltransferase family 4 protein [Aurantimonas sp. C2-6-R+9]